MNRGHPASVWFRYCVPLVCAVQAFAVPAAAGGLGSDASLILEVSRSIEELHERVWRIQDDAARRRTGGLAAGLVVGGGIDISDDDIDGKGHAAPIVAGRIYFFDTDRVLAGRAVERLNHIETFSLPDVSRLIAEASRRLDSRRRELGEALSSIERERERLVQEEGRLSKAIEAAQCKKGESQPAGVPAPQATGASLAATVACAEDLQSYTATQERTLYVFQKQLEARGELAELDRSLAQVKLAERECTELLRTVQTLRDSAREAETGKLFGGSFVEVFLGLGLDIVGDRSEESSSSRALVGLGYGFGSISAGLYAARDFYGLYLGVAVPLFER